MPRRIGRVLVLVGLQVGGLGAVSAEAAGGPHAARTGDGAGAGCSACHVVGESAHRSIAGAWALGSGPQLAAYESGTLDARSEGAGAASLVCLSCHDGTVASAHGLPLRADSDLSNDHPIGVRYDSILASRDGGLHDPATRASGLGGTIETDLLISGRLECTSCHDPHAVVGAGRLRVSVEGSALCLVCHAK